MSSIGRKEQIRQQKKQRLPGPHGFVVYVWAWKLIAYYYLVAMFCARIALLQLPGAHFAGNLSLNLFIYIVPDAIKCPPLYIKLYCILEPQCEITSKLITVINSSCFSTWRIIFIISRVFSTTNIPGRNLCRSFG